MEDRIDFGLITESAETYSNGREIKYAVCIPCDKRMRLSRVARHQALVHESVFTCVREGAAEAIWSCSWLIDHGYSEDGDPIILECGATAHEVGVGWTCANGHEHLGIEIEWAPFGPEWQRDQLERVGR